MSKSRDRIVYQRKDGTWVNKRNDAEHPSSTHKTQSDAIQNAKGQLRKSGGGELI